MCKLGLSPNTAMAWHEDTNISGEGNISLQCNVHVRSEKDAGERVGILSVEYNSPSTMCRNSRMGRTHDDPI